LVTGVISVKKFIPLFILLLLFNSCAKNTATTPPQITPPLATAPQAAPPSAEKLPPDWQYNLTRDGIYRTDQNTGDVIKINGQEGATGIITTEDWVYYCDDNGYLSRMDNENKIELLANEKSWPLRLVGENLYYLDDSGVNMMNLDGSGKEPVFQSDYTGIEMTDTYIFYTLETPESKENNELPGAEDGPWYLGEMHRVGLDGEGDVIVAALITDFNVYENRIFYSDGEDQNYYSLIPETLEKTKISNAYMAEGSCLSDGYLFFMSSRDRCFYKLSLTDGTLTWLADGWPRCRGILDGYVYIDTFTDEAPGLYRIKTDSTKLELVAASTYH
jgi:hypothetical protein